MNRKAKHNIFHSLHANKTDNDNKFWKAVKPIFSNSDPMGEIFTLIENGEVMSDDKAIAECLHSHFVMMTDSLGLNPSFKRIDMAIDKYKSQTNITAIKRRVKVCEQFEFGNVDLFNTMRKNTKP